MKRNPLFLAASLMAVIFVHGCASTSNLTQDASEPVQVNTVRAQASERNIADDALFKNAGDDILVIGDSPVLGDDDAPVTVVAYTDLTARSDNNSVYFFDSIYKEMIDLHNAHPDKVRIVYKHYIDIMFNSNNTIPAHRAIEAAHMQGKFWEYINRLYKYGTILSEQELLFHARALGLNIEQFKTDMWSDEVKTRILNDLRQNKSNRGYGAFIFVNGRSLNRREIHHIEDYYAHELSQVYHHTKTSNAYFEHAHDNLNSKSRKYLCRAERDELEEIRRNLDYLSGELISLDDFSDVDIEDVDYGVDNARFYIDIKDAAFIGNPDSLVTMVGLVDFKSIESYGFHQRMKNIIQRLNAEDDKIDLKFVYMPAPDVSDPESYAAAIAFEAAANQNKSYEMAEIMFNHRDSLTQNDLNGYAKEIGLNVQKFKSDCKSKSVKSRLDKVIADNSRPHIAKNMPYVNGKKSYAMIRPDLVNKVLRSETELADSYISKGIQPRNVYKAVIDDHAQLRSIDEARVAAKVRIESNNQNIMRRIEKYRREMDPAFEHYGQDDETLGILLSELKSPESMKPSNSRKHSSYLYNIDDVCNLDIQNMLQIIDNLDSEVSSCSDGGILNTDIKVYSDGSTEVEATGGSLKDTPAETCILQKLTAIKYPQTECDEAFYLAKLNRMPPVFRMDKTLNLYTKDGIDSLHLAPASLYSYPVEHFPVTHPVEHFPVRRIDNEQQNTTQRTDDDSGAGSVKPAPKANKFVKKIGNDTYEVSKDVVDQIRKDPDSLNDNPEFGAMPQAVPIYKGGKLAGFRLLGVDSNSIYHEIGLKSGDTILDVNGQPMDDIQKINMSLFNTIKPDQDNAIKIMRSGQEKTLTFRIK